MAIITMSKREEIFNWIKEHPQITEISTKSIKKGLPWIGSGAISSALFAFRIEGRIEETGLEGKCVIYKRTRNFGDDRKFKSIKKPRESYNRKKGYKCNTQLREKLRLKTKKTNKEIVLERMTRLKEVLLDVSEEMEELENFVKKELIV